MRSLRILAGVLAAAAFTLTAKSAFCQCSCGPGLNHPPSPMTYRLDTNVPTIDLSTVRAYTDYGSGQWNGVYQARGTAASITFGQGGWTVYVTDQIHDGQAYSDDSTKQIVIPAEWFNSTAQTFPTAYIQAVILHEMGHMEGLSQATCAHTSVMSDTNLSWYTNTFTTCDIASFNAFYGAPAGGGGGDDCSEGTECWCDAQQGEWDPNDGHCALPNCPVMINLDRTGSYHLTSPADGVLFDLDADKALERLAWTPANSSLAFLALDRNGNGEIDDGTEVFGNHTPVPGGGGTAKNGFEALRFLLAPGVVDNTLDARSPAWSKLLLWVDANHNGVSEPDELIPIAGSGIVAINLTYTVENRRDAFGNMYRLRAQVVWADGHKQPIYDVWLMHQ